MGFDPIKEISDWWSRLSGNDKSSAEYQDFVKRMQELMDKPYDIGDIAEVPDMPEYEYIEGDNRTDEELKELAKTNLKEYEQEMRRQIENSLKQESSTLDSNRQSAEQSKQDKTNQIESKYSQDKQNLTSDMSKQGLQRSSISSNKNAKLDETKDSEMKSVGKKYGDIIKNLDIKIAGLEDKRNQALADFDIVYAAKLTQNINQLISQRDKTNNEATRYNNELREQEQKDYGTYLSNKDKYESVVEAVKQKELEKRQQQFFEEAKQILKGLSPAQARDKLENDPIFNNLPNYLHNLLLKQFVL